MIKFNPIFVGKKRGERMGIFKKRESSTLDRFKQSFLRQVTIDDETPNAATDFNVRNEVAESVATYLGAYNTSANRLSLLTNNPSFLRRLVKHALHNKTTYVYKSPTYGWLMTNAVVVVGMRAQVTFVLPPPLNSSVTMTVPFYDLGIIDSPLVDVDTEEANKMLEAAYNAVIKKLHNTGAIKAFITSDLDMSLNKMKEDADEKIKAMLVTAELLSGYTFLERGDEVTQMMPDYTTSNVTDFAAMRTFAASQLSVSDKILDGSATDGEKVAVMFRFVEPILEQFREYEPSLIYAMRDEFFVSFMTTGGMLNSNRIEGWGKEKAPNGKGTGGDVGNV